MFQNILETYLKLLVKSAPLEQLFSLGSKTFYSVTLVI